LIRRKFVGIHRRTLHRKIFKRDFTEEKTVRSLFYCFGQKIYRRVDLENCFEEKKRCKKRLHIEM